MSLTVSMRDAPENSEMVVLQGFVIRAMEIQTRLGEDYQSDQYLIGRLPEAIYIPTIQDFLEDLPTRTVQSLIHRVGGKISHRPRTVGDA